MMTPQRSWHARVVNRLTSSLESQAPSGIVVELEMTVRLDERNRPEPDILATSAPFESGRTWHSPADVLLAVEVVSPESAHRDQHVKLRKYAEAGIPHYWIVEEHETKPVVRVYELDKPTNAYSPVGIFRSDLKLEFPFPIVLDLDNLVRAK